MNPDLHVLDLVRSENAHQAGCMRYNLVPVDEKAQKVMGSLGIGKEVKPECHHLDQHSLSGNYSTQGYMILYGSRQTQTTHHPRLRDQNFLVRQKKRPIAKENVVNEGKDQRGA